MVDLEQHYLDKYPTLSISTVQKYRSWFSDESKVDSQLSKIHNDHKRLLERGRHIDSGPLLHILSVNVKPNDGDDYPISVYGTIYAESRCAASGIKVRHDIYRRECDHAETVPMSGANLTLTSPDYLCPPQEAYIPMSRSLIYAELFDGAHNELARACFSLDGDSEAEDAYHEQVIPCDKVCITVHYIVIPLGVFGRIRVDLYDKEEREHLNVSGRITARHENTFGSYDDAQECIIFDNQTTQLKPFGNLSRCWVGVPAYSSLVFDIDLSDTDTGRKIIKDSVHLPAASWWTSSDFAVSGNFFVRVAVAWFSPEPLRSCKQDGSFRHEKPLQEVDEIDTDDDGDGMDTDGGDDDDDDEEPEDDELPPVARWPMTSHKEEVCQYSAGALEIFSISIWGKQFEPEATTLQIYGCIDVFSGEQRICYLMKRDDENNPLRMLSGKANSIPIPDGCRHYSEDRSFEMKFDMKDVDGHLAIKGCMEWCYDWNDRIVEQQLCSVIQGSDGFVAVHYSVFAQAVQANIQVFVNLKKESVRRKVYGSLITEYDGFGYPTRYHKEQYRIALFKRNEDEAVQPSSDGAIPLSRSLLVVPSYCSLIMNVDISPGVSGHRLVCAIGEGLKTIETDDCIMRIVINWCEINDTIEKVVVDVWNIH